MASTPQRMRRPIPDEETHVQNIARWVDHRKRAMRAVCTHNHPSIQKAARDAFDGITDAPQTVTCPWCGETIDLTPLSAEQLRESLRELHAVCDTIKLFNNGSSTDQRVIKQVVAPVAGLGTFIPELYEMARYGGTPTEEQIKEMHDACAELEPAIVVDLEHETEIEKGDV